jgi:hypothetical protein
VLLAGRRGLRAAVWVGALLASTLLAQRGFRRFYDEEDVPIPPDANEQTEYYFARLQYPSWRGSWRSSWATDYPKADRIFLRGVRRLSRIHARSMEQVISIDSDEIFNYPWIYAVEVGQWGLSDTQAARLRDYLNRGGFLMVDDFHADYEWDVFMQSMRRVFPERTVEDISDPDQILHVLYDLSDRYQVPGIHYKWSGSLSEKGGVTPHWRTIRDDKGRIVVAICHNMDLGDAWEWADDPEYPEKFAALAYRVALNYIIYSMSH